MTDTATEKQERVGYETDSEGLTMVRIRRESAMRPISLPLAKGSLAAASLYRQPNIPYNGASPSPTLRNRNITTPPSHQGMPRPRRLPKSPPSLLLLARGDPSQRMTSAPRSGLEKPGQSGSQTENSIQSIPFRRLKEVKPEAGKRNRWNASAPPGVASSQEKRASDIDV